MISFGVGVAPRRGPIVFGRVKRTKQFDKYDQWINYVKFDGTGCGFNGVKWIPDGTIEHPEEGHYETMTVTDKAAWDERIIESLADWKWVTDTEAHDE